MQIYISLTSIFKNQHFLLNTLKTIVTQTLLPNKIYINLSEESYLLDTGFKDKKITNDNLLQFLKQYNKLIEIKWVENHGPYRKLLPILKDKWNEDCLIITIDDDILFDKNLVKNLIDDYNRHKCVISYRGYGMGILNNDLSTFKYDFSKVVKKKNLYNLSTNGAGTLWKPQFFHKTDNLIFNKDIYMNYCNTGDDLWYCLIRIFNNIECYIDNDKRRMEFQGSYGLFPNYNNRNNKNTLMFINTFRELKKRNNNT